MEVLILDSQEAIGVVVADVITALLARKPAAALGLATGSSPLPIYSELIGRHRLGEISFAQSSAFLLDEYVGLSVTHEQSYRNVIEREFAGSVDFHVGAVQGPDGLADDLLAECSRYDKLVVESVVDLQLLGLGSDGHIGFNEPSSSLASRTRLKTLTSQTRGDNARFFGGDASCVPAHVITQGIGTLLEASHLIMVAFGVGKAETVVRMIEGPVASMCPASALQLHPHVTVVLDESAASRLTLADFYRETARLKPPWQPH